jgi:hypothetical protein
VWVDEIHPHSHIGRVCDSCEEALAEGRESLADEDFAAAL